MSLDSLASVYLAAYRECISAINAYADAETGGPLLAALIAARGDLAAEYDRAGLCRQVRIVRHELGLGVRIERSAHDNAVIVTAFHPPVIVYRLMGANE